MLFDVLEQMANDLIQQLLRAEHLHLALLGRFDRRLRLVRLKELLHALSPARSVPTGSVRPAGRRLIRDVRGQEHAVPPVDAVQQLAALGLPGRVGGAPCPVREGMELIGHRP